MNRALPLLLVLLVASPAAAIGALDGISPGETLSPGLIRTVVLPEGGRPESGNFEMELVLSLDGGETFPLRVSSEVPGETARLSFRAPNLPTPTAQLALRVGRNGEAEETRAVSEPFSIAPSCRAPLEELRVVRGEPATRDVTGASGWPLIPDGLSGERPDRFESAGDDGGVEDDSISAAIPSDPPSTEIRFGAPLTGGKPPRPSRSRAP